MTQLLSVFESSIASIWCCSGRDN